MNPRYPQPQQAPVDNMTRQLQQLTALKGLGGHEQLQQQQLGQQDEQSRMQLALHLLGLQQQGQEQQGTQDFRNKQLELEGQRNKSEADFRTTSANNEKDYHQHALASQIFGDALRTPGGSIHDALNLGGIYDPAMHVQANQMMQAQRAQAIERVYPMLKLIQDPNAREVTGRTQLSMFPGAYEEALSKAFPQSAPGGAVTPQPIAAPDGQTQTPLLTNSGINSREGIRRNPAIEAAYRALYGGPAADSPALDVITKKTGKDFTALDFGYPN